PRSSDSWATGTPTSSTPSSPPPRRTIRRCATKSVPSSPLMPTSAPRAGSQPRRRPMVLGSPTPSPPSPRRPRPRSRSSSSSATNRPRDRGRGPSTRSRWPRRWVCARTRSAVSTQPPRPSLRSSTLWPIGCRSCSRSPTMWRPSTSATSLLLPVPAPPLDRLTAELAAAKRPVLLAGRGAWLSGAQDELGALATATGALTATSALGRNVFPEPEFDLGVAGGFGAPAAMERIRQADVAVVFGASLNQFTMRFGDLFHPDTTVWQIDTDDRATNARVSGFVRSDVRLAAAELVSRLDAAGAEASGWRESVDTTADRVYEVGTEFADDGRLD